MKAGNYSQERRNILFNMERAETYEEFMRLSQMLDLLDNKIEFMEFIEEVGEDGIDDQQRGYRKKALTAKQTKKFVISKAINSKNEISSKHGGKKPRHHSYE